MGYRIWITWKESEDAEWKDEYYGDFDTEDEANDASGKITEEWLASHNPYRWDWEAVFFGNDEGKDDDECETKQFLVTVTVKKGFSPWDVMRIAEDRAWYAEGIENFDYDEYDAI